MEYSIEDAKRISEYSNQIKTIEDFASAVRQDQKQNCPLTIFLPMSYPLVISDRYNISEFGDIYDTWRGIFIKPHIDTKGYIRCNLMNPNRVLRTYSIHRLVAWEFVPYRRNLSLQVNHIDGNKKNNHFSNLEWCTNQENCQHAWNTGLVTNHIMGEFNGNSHLSKEAVEYIWKLLITTELSYTDIAKEINNVFGLSVHRHTVSDIAHCKSWEYIGSKYETPKQRVSGHRGEKQNSSKLTWDAVHYIREQAALNQFSHQHIAEKVRDLYGVNISPGQIGSIIRGIYWKEDGEK